MALRPAVGQAACAFDLFVTGTDGAVTKVNGVSRIDAFVQAGAGRMEHEALHQARGGEVRVEVRSDCLWAVSLSAAPSTR
jgi:hypothetical protein